MLFLFTDVRGIANRKHVQEGYEQVQQALLEYTVTCYPQVQVCRKKNYVYKLFEWNLNKSILFNVTILYFDDFFNSAERETTSVHGYSILLWI